MTYIYNGTRRLVRTTPEPAGPWLQTLGGGRLDLVSPRPEQINIRHAIRVVCRIPRFGGHTEGPAGEIYSVGQHSREGARAIMRDTGREDAARAFVAHDLHEYALGDRATPVAHAHAAVAQEIWGWRQACVVEEAWAALKSRLDVAIHAAAGIPYPLAPDVRAIVKDYDRRMCAAEHRARLLPLPAPYPYIEDAPPVVGCDFHPYLPGTIEALLLASAQEYGIRVDNPDLRG